MNWIYQEIWLQILIIFYRFKHTIQFELYFLMICINYALSGLSERQTYFGSSYKYFS